MNPGMNPELQKLAAEKARLSRLLTGLMLLAYFGFVLLLAFAPQVLAAPVGNATLGIPVGIGVIIIACLLTGFYVRWANTHLDHRIATFKADLQATQSTTPDA